MNDSLSFYFSLVIVVMLVVSMISDVATASIVITAILLFKYIQQTKCFQLSHVGGSNTEGLPPQSTPASEPVPEPAPEPIQLSKETIDNIENTVMDVIYPSYDSADDKIFAASISSGKKNKKAKEIRSHWNNNNWKKYFDYELEMHSQENRDWWENDEYELAKKHVVL